MAMYGTGAYAAAKAAVAAYSRVLAVELAPHQIRVDAVAPGPVATEQLRQVYAGPKYCRTPAAAFRSTVSPSRRRSPI
jgi:NAD(P)-dependent dehydrogenase (short-subunit alcohol dehydrogenase family)